MHGADLPPVESPAQGDASALSGPWYRGMNRYHWFVLAVAALGWLFDCLDQQLFVLARPAAMKELVAADIAARGPGQPVLSPMDIKTMESDYSGTVTAVFLMGWAIGGLIFGVLGDRIGRAKTMMITILLYSAFTGLSALSRGFADFALYRFLTGLGVGGEFAVGVALVAEVMPDRARPYALMILQMLSAIGNVGAALTSMSFGVLEEKGLIDSPWRWMFVIGAVPALLALVIRARLKEPERWQRMRKDPALKRQMGSYRELFGHPTWRRHALLGLLLAFSGVVGLWAVGFFTPDLTGKVLRAKVVAQVHAEKGTTTAALTEPQNTQLKQTVEQAVDGRMSYWRGVTSIMLQFGGFLGIFAFGMVAQRIGRRPTFAIAFIAAGASTAALFWTLSEFSQLFWMVPIMGFCQLSVFGGYAMYFPELFPTNLRSTGTSFCYNVGRFVAALGPFALGRLQGVFSDKAEPLRYAGVTMCSVFLLGLFVLPFVPETRGKPLPE